MNYHYLLIWLNVFAAGIIIAELVVGVYLILMSYLERERKQLMQEVSVEVNLTAELTHVPKSELSIR